MTRLRTELDMLSMTAERETERNFHDEVRVSALTCAQRKILGGMLKFSSGRLTVALNGTVILPYKLGICICMNICVP